jgi:subtilisin family serine protease
VAVKVLDSGNAFCCTVRCRLGAGLDPHQPPGHDVVNTSLGTSALFSGDCDAASSNTIALAVAVDNLVSNGTMVFASSGNQASPSATSAPACLFAAISVGAVWDAERPDTTFMGCTDTAIEPDKPTCFTNSDSSVDLYAPGAFVTASGLGGTVSTYGGTSQASPLVAGCATVLRSAFPDATTDEITAALKASPTRITDPKNGLSFARLDCANAMLRLDGVLFADNFEQ